jgi:hypothetical protein
VVSKGQYVRLVVFMLLYILSCGIYEDKTQSYHLHVLQHSVLQRHALRPGNVEGTGSYSRWPLFSGNAVLISEKPIHPSQCTHPFESDDLRLARSFRMPSSMPVVVVNKMAVFVGLEVVAVTAD